MIIHSLRPSRRMEYILSAISSHSPSGGIGGMRPVQARSGGGILEKRGRGEWGYNRDYVPIPCLSSTVQY